MMLGAWEGRSVIPRRRNKAEEDRTLEEYYRATAGALYWRSWAMSFICSPKELRPPKLLLTPVPVSRPRAPRIFGRCY